ncbi:MAG: endo alpha-1,4 polygalactosaminidase [Rickettsiales bacterium]|nr:endo alpha-1,4 polygalactosaminidase [Rickettsiales bacterium]
MSDLAFFYQLSGLSNSVLGQRDFTLAVIDDNDAGLTSGQIASFESEGKHLMAYASAGEAEAFRDYWTNNDWDNTPPDFLLGQNPNWATGYRVKFWDPDWQEIVINRVKALSDKGYLGAYLDVVDVYTVGEVITAYNNEFPSGDIRQEMEDFIKLISSEVKSINPDFKIVVQNAVALLNEVDIGSLLDPLQPNQDYLDAIDGLGKETTFVLGDTVPIGWGPWDAKYVENAVNAGKLVIALEYPTPGNQTAIDYAISEAFAAGYLPYLDTRVHNGGWQQFPENYATDENASQALLDLLDDFVNGSGGGGGTVITLPSNDAEEIVGTAGNDTFNGGGGDDTIYGLDGNDLINGGDDNDRLLGWYGDDTLLGEAGDDSLFGDFGHDSLNGGDGNDYIYGWSGNDSIIGGTGSDVLYGDAGVDTVHGGAGDDVFFGSTGNDLVYGDDGDDDLFGDEDHDTLYGGAGNDQLYGWTGDDWLAGDSGNDSIAGDDGADRIDAGTGNDWVYAGSGADLVFLGEGDDWAFGDAGNDTINGGDGADVIFAWEGNDELFGDAGNDFISAEQGDDYIHGGAGDDELYGGAGFDLFAYDGGIDTIRDFVIGQDQVLIIGFDADYASVIDGNVFYAGGRATIDFGSSGSLNFDNIADGAFSASDFQFA